MQRIKPEKKIKRNFNEDVVSLKKSVDKMACESHLVKVSGRNNLTPLTGPET